VKALARASRSGNGIGGVRFGSQATQLAGAVEIDAELSDDMMQQELEYFVLGTDEGLDHEEIRLLEEAPLDPYDDLLPFDEQMLLHQEETQHQVHDFFLARILPCETVHTGLHWMLTTTGLPWFGVILLTPVIMKAVLTIPLAVLVQKKQEKTMPRMTEGLKRIQGIKEMYKDDARMKAEKLKELKKELGFNPVTQPFRNAAPLIASMPIHMTFFFAIRTMYPKFESWAEGGALWFTDLSIPDPTWALPVFCGAAMLLNTEVVTSRMPDNPMKPVMKIGMRCMSFGTIFIMHYLTAGFNLYAFANTITFAIQSRLLFMDAFRKGVGLKPQSYMQAMQKQAENARQAMQTNKKDEAMSYRIESNPSHTGVLYEIKPAEKKKRTQAKPRLGKARKLRLKTS